MNNFEEKMKENENQNENKKWYLQLPKDFYIDTKIRHIETQPKGKKKAYVYIKLLCLGTSKGGALMITDSLPFTDKDIANQINEPLAIVKETLCLLEEMGILEILKKDGKDIYFLKEVATMQQSRKDTPGNRRKKRQLDKEKKDHALEEILGQASKGITTYS